MLLGRRIKGSKNGLIWYVSLFVPGIGLGSARRIRGLLGSLFCFVLFLVFSLLWYGLAAFI